MEIKEYRKKRLLLELAPTPIHLLANKGTAYTCWAGRKKKIG
jgi:hypothetical protein